MVVRFAFVAAALLATPALAAPARKSPPPKPYVAPPLHDIERVAITTELGVITLDLEGKRAPISTANFLHYVDTKRFDGMTFYRSMHLPWGDQPNGLVQAGVRGHPLKVYPPVAHEPTSQTGVLHKAGTISLARLAPGTATGDFSIMLADLDGLDAKPDSTDPEAQAGYAAFGHVVEGMDVVRKIWDQPIDAEKGEGFMKGQMIAQPVKVLTVRRVAMPDAPKP